MEAADMEEADKETPGKLVNSDRGAMEAQE